MRSLEYLIQLFPDKTAKEIKAIQEQDRLQDEAEEKERNAAKIAWMEEINTNGGYFRGRFGLDQRYFYRCFNVQLEDGTLYMSVESIVIFMGEGATSRGEFSAERRLSNFERVDRYALDCDDKRLIQRVTEKEWNEVKTYLENVAKFWE